MSDGGDHDPEGPGGIDAIDGEPVTDSAIRAA